MKCTVKNNKINYFLNSLFLILPFLGFYLSGVVALLGIGVAYIVERIYPKWVSGLNWNDINIAIQNVYNYGNNPCELCFMIDNRKIYVYRDQKEGPTRIGLRIPLKYWNDLFSEKQLEDLRKPFGGWAIYTTNRGPRSFLFFPNGDVESCVQVLKFLLEQCSKNLYSDLFAEAIVNSKKDIWKDHQTNVTV